MSADRVGRTENVSILRKKTSAVVFRKKKATCCMSGGMRDNAIKGEKEEK